MRWGCPSHRSSATAWLAVAVLALVAACTGDDDEGPAGEAPDAPVPTRGGAVVVGVVGDPATLDPYSALASDLTFALARPIWPSLYRFGPDGETEPDLARSVTPVEGGVRVTLRTARWSDGSPIGSHDVVASVRRARAPSGFARIRAVAVGPRAVRFRGRSDDWEQTLATIGFVLPGGRARTDISGGPFVMAAHRPGLHVVYERNPRWWGRGAYLRRVTVQFVAGMDILLRLLEEDRLDAAVPLSTVNLDERLAALEVTSADALGWESIYLDLQGWELDEAARASLVAAVDRPVIEAGFVRGDGRVSTTLHPGPGSNGAAGPWRQPPARGESQQQVFSIEMAAASGDELTTLIQRVLQLQLAAAGFEVELVRVEPSMFYGRWSQDDPTDAAVRRAAGAPGLEDRPEAREDGAALPLLHVESVIAWHRHVHGPEPNPTFEGPLWNLKNWFVTPDLNS
jgi:ABC-type transport system substrate-binding protein